MSPVQRLMHRDVNHAVGRRSAVPVFFVGWHPHRIAGADFTDRTALGLYPSDAGNDKKRLSERVGMPCGTRARLECDATGIDPRWRWRRIDRILPDRTGEPIARRAPGGP